MSGGSGGPRQKMINLMYLVLTALLALNVSTDVLKGFDLVNEALIATNKVMGGRNAQEQSSFQLAWQKNPGKAAEWKPKVDETSARIEEYKAYLDSLMNGLVSTPETPGGRIDSVLMKDNLDISANYMVNEGRGRELKKKINDLGTFLTTEIVDSAQALDLYNQIKALTATPDPPVVEGQTISWEQERFEGMPLVAAVTMLLKLKSDAETIQGNVYNYLKNQISYEPFKFNSIEAVVVKESGFVTEGGTFKATIFTSAVDTTQKPQVFVGNTQITTYNDKNQVLYSSSARGIGEKKVSGRVELQAADGSTIPFPFDFSYMVTRPALVVSPVKMNVVYRLIDNPVLVSVPGYRADQLSVSFTNVSGSPKRQGEQYIVRPGSGKTCKVSVSAKNSEGKTISLGSFDFRVKNVPPPIAMVGGVAAGSMKRGTLAAMPGISAQLKNFDFDLKFVVTKFTMSYTDNQGFSVDIPGTGAYFNDKQKRALKAVGVGKKVTFSDIWAKMSVSGAKPIKLDNGVIIKVQ